MDYEVMEISSNKNKEKRVFPTPISTIVSSRPFFIRK